MKAGDQIHASVFYALHSSVSIVTVYGLDRGSFSSKDRNCSVRNYVQIDPNLLWDSPTSLSNGTKNFAPAGIRKTDHSPPPCADNSRSFTSTTSYVFTEWGVRENFTCIQVHNICDSYVLAKCHVIGRHTDRTGKCTLEVVLQQCVSFMPDICLYEMRCTSNGQGYGTHATCLTRHYHYINVSLGIDELYTNIE